MDKSRKPYDAKKALVINSLAAKHKCSKEMVRKSINGEKHSVFAELLRSEYNTEYNKLAKALD